MHNPYRRRAGEVSVKAIWSLVAAALSMCAVLVPATATATALPSTRAAVATVSDPFNTRLSVVVSANARFSVGAFPDAVTGAATAGSFPLLFGWPTTSTSFATVMVDGVPDVYGLTGTQVQAPTETPAGDDTSAWSDGEVTTRQTLSLAANPDTGLVDAVRIAYTVTNTGSLAHSVGVRVLLDTDIDNNDGAPFLMAGAGPITTEEDLTGAAVPDHFQVLPALGADTRLAGATLRGSGATAPDRLVFADWPQIEAAPWDYTITPGRPITTDGAYAVYWNPQALGPGASTTYVTYFGLSRPPPPTVTAVTPASGPAAGGTQVTVTGTALSGVTAVDFGGTPSSGIFVDSPTEVSATVPAGSGTVDVTVTTPSGTSAPSAADHYTYAGAATTSAPVSKTSPVGAIGPDSAELVATVNPRGLATTVHFEYGGDDATGATAAAATLDQRTPDQTVDPDFADHTVTAEVASLTPNSTYHVRAVATNAKGTTTGDEVTFTTASDAPPPPPVLGRAFNAQPVTGRVFVLLPTSAGSGQARASAAKGNGFIPLTEARQLPVGTEFDAAAGSVRLTTAAATRGRVLSGTFGSGVFKLLQNRRARGLSELSLVVPSGASRTCAATAGKAQTAARRALPKTVLDRLRAKATGHFQTHGRYSSATVRGTSWTTTDRCDGTLTLVARGVVVVSDLRRKRQIVVRAGRGYLARAP
jgi:hypothetical protein